MALAGFKNIDHLVIGASDIDATIAFYTDMFGWVKEFDEYMDGPDFEAVVRVPGAHGRTCGGHIAGLRVEFVHMSWRANTPRPDGAGLRIFTIEVEDAQKAWEDCVSRGVPTQGPPNEVAGCRIFFMTGPDEQLIEVVEYTPRGGWGWRTE